MACSLHRALSTAGRLATILLTMADKNPILSIDDDWKRQAQEEKRRLAEQEKKEKEAAAPAAPVAPSASPDISTQDMEAAADTPFAALIQSLLTQSLVYLGGMASRTGQPMLNLDSARRAVDMLGSLDEKTKGNLSDLEQRILDTALYEARNRFVSVASQFIGP